MTFIITLIALVMERFFHWSHLRSWRWLTHYQHWLSRTRMANRSSYLLLLVCVLPPVLLVGLVNYLLADVFYGSLKLLFGVLVLMYCLGPKNLWVQVYTSINELHKDEPGSTVAQASAALGVESSEHASSFAHAIFISAYQRVFDVFFWFILLGPAGAILYRAIALISLESPVGMVSVALNVRRLLDWVPVRIFAFLFALGGHFMKVFICWKQALLKGPESNDAMLAECGMAALDMPEGASSAEAGKEAVALLDRVFIIALVLVAFLVLFI